MALVIEDGTGVSNAQSWATVAELEAYAAARGITLTGTTAEKEQRLVLAGDYLANEQRFHYRGNRATYTQRLPIPRTGMSEVLGPVYPDNFIPWRIKDAQIELAILAQSRTLQGVLERGGDIRSLKVDVISIDFGDKATPEDVFQTVIGLITPLLRSPDHVEPQPYLNAPTTGYYGIDTQETTE